MGSPLNGSSLVNRSFALGERRTSMRLEPAFWGALQAMAEARGLTIGALVTEILGKAQGKRKGTLTSAVRVAILNYAANERAAAMINAALAKMERDCQQRARPRQD